MMEDTTSKEKILKKIRKALIHKSEVDYNGVDFESEIYQPAEEPLEFIFAQQLLALNGKFIFCENDDDFMVNFAAFTKENNWTSIFCFDDEQKVLLKKAGIDFSADITAINTVDVGVTGCEYLVARTGTVLVSSKQNSGRRLPAYSNIHIVVAYTKQLVYTMKDALKEVKNKYGNNFPSQLTAITGPSRTADIEKTLVQGAHGPKEIFVFLIDNGHL